ncbi:MotA/TolQ/ExbB proton channel family protein [Algivirga pacifica]|uniref:MotA/TolQ/ExbB proton channel family protein n=1 Tax=Algivirga pacifica TaxID=1162670 RepID=A0ABP9D814_9BACT
MMILAFLDLFGMDIPGGEESLLGILAKGGVTMIVLAVLFVVNIYIFFNRVVVISKAKKEPRALLDNVLNAVKSGDLETAKSYCRKDPTPMAKMLKAGLDRITSPLKNIEVAIENVGKIELYYLEKNVSILGMISGAAPMIGFFGTVIGMINAFMSMDKGNVDTSDLAGGIYEAMVTTAGGLFVGIIAYISYNYIVRQIEEVVHNMEVASIEFVDMLQAPTLQN